MIEIRQPRDALVGGRLHTKDQIDLRALIQETVDARRDELSAAGFTVETALPPTLPPVFGDPHWLRTALDTGRRWYVAPIPNRPSSAAKYTAVATAWPWAAARTINAVPAGRLRTNAAANDQPRHRGAPGSPLRRSIRRRTSGRGWAPITAASLPEVGPRLKPCP